MENMNITPMGLTSENASAYSGIGINLLRRLVQAGKLPALRVGKRLIFKRDVLDRFLEINMGADLMDTDSIKPVTIASK